MSRKRWRNLLFYALHCTGFILLYFVIRRLEFHKLLDMMLMFPVWKIFLGLGLLILVYLVKTLRWFLINRVLEIRTSFHILLMFFLVSGFLSVITPGRLGEFAKIYFLKKKYPVSVTMATSSVLLDRIWDVLILSLMAVSSMVLMISSFQVEAWTILLISLLLLCSLFAIIFPGIMFRPALWIIRKGSLHDDIESVFRQWKKSRFRFLVPGLLTSLLAFLLLASIPLMFSVELDAPVAWTSSISAVSISNILSFIPITIAGFGTRELVFTGIWDMNNYAAETAIAVSTIYFAITYLGSLLLGGLVYLLGFRRMYSMKEIREQS
jgi:uncharacterized protein (TIRG00374 family)